MSTPDIDAIAENLEFLGRTGAALPPGWDGAKCKSIVCGPQGQHVGHILHGRGLYLDMDLKALGINRKLRRVFERSQIKRRVEAFEKRWGVVSEIGPFIDPITRSVIDPERMAIRAANARILEKRRGVVVLSDAVLREMAQVAAITTYDGIISARAGGLANDIWIGKQSITTTANDWYSFLRLAGTPAAMTLNATTAPTQTACDRTTTGAWSTGLFNPGGANKKYLLTFGWTAGQQINAGCLIDVHVQGGAFRLTVGTAETVASPVTIVRQYYAPLGAGCYITGITTTGASATATNLTVTYVDQDGNTGITVAVVNPATATIADEIWPDSSAAVNGGPFWNLASGDYGVRQMSSTTSSVSLGAGQINIILATPLMFIPGIAASVYVERDSTVQIDGLTELVTSGGVIGCLNMLGQTNTTSIGASTYFMRTCEG